MKILCFGDSNTYGLVPGTKERLPQDKRYPYVLNNALGEEFKVFSDGVCGRTTVFFKGDICDRSSLKTIKDSVLEYSPDVLIIMLGTNDLKSVFNASAADIAQGMGTLFDLAREENPALKAVFVSPVKILPCALTKADYFNAASLTESEKLSYEFKRQADKKGAFCFDAASVAYADEADGEHMNAREVKKLSLALANYLITNVLY